MTTKRRRKSPRTTSPLPKRPEQTRAARTKAREKTKVRGRARTWVRRARAKARRVASFDHHPMDKGPVHSRVWLARLARTVGAQREQGPVSFSKKRVHQCLLFS